MLKCSILFYFYFYIIPSNHRIMSTGYTNIGAILKWSSNFGKYYEDNNSQPYKNCFRLN